MLTVLHVRATPNVEAFYSCWIKTSRWGLIQNSLFNCWNSIRELEWQWGAPASRFKGCLDFSLLTQNILEVCELLYKTQHMHLMWSGLCGQFKTRSHITSRGTKKWSHCRRSETKDKLQDWISTLIRNMLIFYKDMFYLCNLYEKNNRQNAFCPFKTIVFNFQESRMLRSKMESFRTCSVLLFIILLIESVGGNFNAKHFSSTLMTQLSKKQK